MPTTTARTPSALESSAIQLIRPEILRWFAPSIQNGSVNSWQSAEQVRATLISDDYRFASAGAAEFEQALASPENALPSITDKGVRLFFVPALFLTSRLRGRFRVLPPAIRDRVVEVAELLAADRETFFGAGTWELLLSDPVICRVSGCRRVASSH